MAEQTRNWGAILTVAIALLACAVAWGATSATVISHADDIVALGETDDKITDILVQLDKNQALILLRLEAIERRGN